MGDFHYAIFHNLGVKVFIMGNDQEIARAYVYYLNNDLHEEPFAFLEDVYIKEDYRHKGLGKKIVQEIIAMARQKGCYKLIATSRFARELVHKFYQDQGFEQYGYEFRLNF